MSVHLFNIPYDRRAASHVFLRLSKVFDQLLMCAQDRTTIWINPFDWDFFQILFLFGFGDFLFV